MNPTASRIASFACAAALAAIGTLGHADEAEIFVGIGNAEEVHELVTGHRRETQTVAAVDPDDHRPHV